MAQQRPLKRWGEASEAKLASPFIATNFQLLGAVNPMEADHTRPTLDEPNQKRETSARIGLSL